MIKQKGLMVDYIYDYLKEKGEVKSRYQISCISEIDFEELSKSESYQEYASTTIYNLIQYAKLHNSSLIVGSTTENLIVIPTEVDAYIRLEEIVDEFMDDDFDLWSVFKLHDFLEALPFWTIDITLLNILEERLSKLDYGSGIMLSDYIDNQLRSPMYVSKVKILN